MEASVSHRGGVSDGGEYRHLQPPDPELAPGWRSDEGEVEPQEMSSKAAAAGPAAKVRCSGR